MNCLIRAASPSDCGALAALSGELGYPATEADIVQRLTEVQANDRHAILVAEIESQVVGWVTIAIVSSLVDDPRADLFGLVVAESHRSQGIGGRLMSAAEAWAADRGLDILRVRTNAIRHRAHRFYEDLGYVLVKQQRVYDKRLPR